MRTSLSALLACSALAALAALGAGCEAESSSSETATLPRLAAAARGSSVVLDAERFVAWVADADNRAIHRVDLRSRAVSTTAVAGRPEQLALVGEDALAVTLRETNQVALFDVEPTDDPESPDVLTLRATADVASDPYGIAVSPRGEILVTSAWGHTVTSLAADTLDRRFTVDVAREPRGIVVSPDGARAFVTHVVGSSITVLTLDGESPTAYRLAGLGGKYKNRLDKASGAGTLHPTAALAYSAVLSPSGARLFVPHTIEQNGADTTRSIPGAYGGVPVDEETSFASVAVFAPEHGTVLGAAPDDAHPVDGMLPIAVDPSLGFAVAPEPAPSRQARGAVLVGDALLVASQGTNQLVELSALAIDPATSVRRVFEVGEGPSGVDADEATGLAVVWNQLSHDLSVVHLATGSTERIPVAADPLPADVAAGRRLFITERDRRITRDGRACAGCHPEGREDGVVWKLGAGPRQTPMLVGRLGSGAFRLARQARQAGGQHGRDHRAARRLRPPAGRAFEARALPPRGPRRAHHEAGARRGAGRGDGAARGPRARGVHVRGGGLFELPHPRQAGQRPRRARGGDPLEDRLDGRLPDSAAPLHRGHGAVFPRRAVSHAGVAARGQLRPDGADDAALGGGPPRAGDLPEDLVK